MSAFARRLQRRLAYWFRRNERAQALENEMRHHLDSMVDDLTGRGMPEGEARAAARRKFGNLTQKVEESRATWISRWSSDAWQDLQFTFRTLRRDAGFSTFAVLIVGLGIGASVTVFSILSALLLRPLPFTDPDRLVWITNSGQQGDLSSLTIRVGQFLALREQNRSFSDIAGYFAFYGVGDNKFTGDGEPERLSGVPVTQNFFSVLGVQPHLGRLFNADECKWNGPKAALLSYGFWKRRFAADPGLVGRKLTLNEQPVTVIGVLPDSFDFATVFAPGSHIDLYFAFPLAEQTDRWGNTLALIGRLKSGMTIPAAQAELSVIAGQYGREHPNLDPFEFRLSLLDQHVSGHLRPALFLLACAVGVVMLIVSANLASLQMARTTTRQKEIAVRVALGAGRHRLIRQLLVESIVLASCGALLGLMLAAAGTRLLTRLESVSVPLLTSIRVDAGALGFTLLVAVLTGVTFGLAPALQASSLTVHDALKDSTRGSSEGKRHSWIRSALVVSEIAFACVLLVGAGLLIRSFQRVLDVNLGFQPERAAAVRIDPGSQYSTQAQRNAYFDKALRGVLQVPGIEAAGLTDVLPLGVNRSWDAGAKGEIYSPNHPPPPAFVRIISEGYLRAMGIPLRAGRDLTERDNASSKKVILINETLARSLWPGQDPLGKTVIGVDTEREVVGVVSDVRHVALEQGSGSEFYIPIRQIGDYASVDLVVRSALPPSQLASAVRGALRPIEPNLPANEFRTLQTLVDKAVSPRRFVVLLLTGFAAFALILASLGIYAVISYAVSRRSREIGIRMALGASARELQGRILAQTLGLTAIGMLLGIIASWVLARSISGLLFGVTASDPMTFLAMAAVLTSVAAMAGYLPARRASRIDPTLALRAD
jgi:predicted permease